MNKKHAHFLATILFFSDIVAVGLCWNLAYYLRFFAIDFPAAKFLPDFKYYFEVTPIVMLMAAFCFAQAGIYQTSRIKKARLENQSILRANLILFISLIAASFYYREYSFSRVHSFYFLSLSIFSLAIIRIVKVKTLRYFRKKGKLQRKAAFIGSGRGALLLMDKIGKNPHFGVNLVGYLDDSNDSNLGSLEKLGGFSEIKPSIKEHHIEQVYVALDSDQQSKLAYINDQLADQVVDVNYIPDIFHTLTINPEVTDFDGLPIITLRQNPVEGWNRFLKRVFDISTSLFSFIIFLPCWLIIPILIKITSRGPIFYKQKRMGLDGQQFQMLKFRTMKVDADKIGDGWTVENDDRRTPIGAFLRKTSLDEVPQFLNVLSGRMSVVGPRPEQPKFIEKFKDQIPNYMLRHKMKAGITGWAQVHGWRGNTSLERRIEFDLYYMTNWSIWLDIKILLLTIFNGFVNKNAY